MNFHSSSEVYNNCISPVYERKDEENDRENYSLSNLQTSHQFLVLSNLNRGFLGPTLTDVPGKNLVFANVGLTFNDLQ